MLEQGEIEEGEIEEIVPLTSDVGKATAFHPFKKYEHSTAGSSTAASLTADARDGGEGMSSLPSTALTESQVENSPNGSRANGNINGNSNEGVSPSLINAETGKDERERIDASFEQLARRVRMELTPYLHHGCLEVCVDEAMKLPRVEVGLPNAPNLVIWVKRSYGNKDGITIAIRTSSDSKDDNNRLREHVKSYCKKRDWNVAVKEVIEKWMQLLQK